MIHCFGDSWIEGIGTEWEPGRGRIPMEDRYNQSWKKIYSKYSWPGQLQEILNQKVNNYGMAGSSNQDIYSKVIESIWTNKIKKGDFVIVSLSSIIRQPLSFFMVKDDYNNSNLDLNGYINYSYSCLSHYINGFENDIHWIDTIKNKKIRNATSKIYKDYLVHRLNYDFLYEISMQYICNLQIYFEELGVDYVFVNAFENNISKKVHFFDQIKQNKWILFDYTLQEYLLDESEDFDTSKGYSVWEDDMIEVERNQDGPHPNRIGHKMIAELIHKEIKNKL
jgi:lysophospholipase L1-like esterase